MTEATTKDRRKIWAWLDKAWPGVRKGLGNNPASLDWLSIEACVEFEADEHAIDVEVKAWTGDRGLRIEDPRSSPRKG